MKTIQLDATKMSLAKTQSKLISYSAESADFDSLLLMFRRSRRQFPGIFQWAG
jgi:hypothetical protein